MGRAQAVSSLIGPVEGMDRLVTRLGLLRRLRAADARRCPHDAAIARRPWGHPRGVVADPVRLLHATPMPSPQFGPAPTQRSRNWTSLPRPVSRTGGPRPPLSWPFPSAPFVQALALVRHPSRWSRNGNVPVRKGLSAGSSDRLVILAKYVAGPPVARGFPSREPLGLGQPSTSGGCGSSYARKPNGPVDLR